MSDLKPIPEKRKIRVRTRVDERRTEKISGRLSRVKVVAVLFAAAVVGIALGIVLGRGANRMVSVHRQQKRIAQSLPKFNPDSSDLAELAPVAEPGKSPAR
jgi:hypothetical protein